MRASTPQAARCDAAVAKHAQRLQQSRAASQDSEPELSYLSSKDANLANYLARKEERVETPPAAHPTFPFSDTRWSVKAGVHLTELDATDAALMRLFTKARRSTDLEAKAGEDEYPTALTPALPSVLCLPAPACAPATPAAAPALPTCATTHSACHSHDLELSFHEAQWLVATEPLHLAVLELAPRGNNTLLARLINLAGQAACGMRHLHTRIAGSSSGMKLHLACLSPRVHE